jgi:hypothetical protein
MWLFVGAGGAVGGSGACRRQDVESVRRPLGMVDIAPVSCQVTPKKGDGLVEDGAKKKTLHIP